MITEIELIRQMKKEFASSQHTNGVAKIDGNKLRLKNVLMEAEQLPPIKRLFGEFIFDNELTVFAGNTNLGKSLLSYQLLNSLAGGIGLFDLENDAEPMNCMLYDFEMNPRSLFKRYPQYREYSENFFIKFGQQVFRETEKFDATYIESDIRTYDLKFVCIDNITALLGNGQDLQTVSTIIELIKSLIELKNKHQINIMLVAHTTKQMPNLPLDSTQIQGSRNLLNLIDSCFMIGAKNEERYISHQKARNGMKYNNVLTLHLNNVEGENKFFEKGLWINEKILLKNEDAEEDVNSDKELVQSLFKNNFEKRYTDLVEDLMELNKCSKWKAKNIIANLINNNILIKYGNKYLINQNELKIDNLETESENIEQTW